MLSGDEKYILRRVIALAPLRGRVSSVFLSLTLVFGFLLINLDLRDRDDSASKLSKPLEWR